MRCGLLQKDRDLDKERHLRRLDTLADWMDSRFRVPGTNIRFGIDAVLGLVPGIGDGVSIIPAVYLIAHAAYLGVPKSLLIRMASNVGVDLLVGSVPLVGDVFDVGFKANRRNIALVSRHVEKESRPLERASTKIGQ
jgi:hypothetical protein